MDDDVGDVGDLPAQLLLELAGQLVSVNQGGLCPDAERQEDDPAGIGAMRSYPQRFGARPREDYPLDLPRGVQVRIRVGRARAERALQGLEVRLHLAHAGAGADRLLDPPGDRERRLQVEVGGELQMQGDAGRPAVLEDRDVVYFLDQRLDQRDCEYPVAEVQAAAARLDVDDNIAAWQRALDRRLPGSWPAALGDPPRPPGPAPR